MNTATKVRELGWETQSTLYRLDPPLRVNDERITHVVVATIVSADSDHGSVVFASNAAGQVTDWGGVTRTDDVTSGAALHLLGYEVRL